MIGIYPRPFEFRHAPSIFLVFFWIGSIRVAFLEGRWAKTGLAALRKVNRGIACVTLRKKYVLDNKARSTQKQEHTQH